MKNNSRTDEIKLMEDVANWLEDWAGQAPQNDIPAFKDHRAKLVSIASDKDAILRWLKFNDKSPVAKIVEEEFGKLIGWVLADVPSEKDLNRTAIQLAQGSAKKLASTLRHIAKLAREELKNKEIANSSIIGWIAEGIIAFALLLICLYFFGTVTGIFVFAALLTILHYLGWLEPIRAFINRVLRLN